MKRIKNKFKQGAASFYIVAFSTLILMILAASFAAVIISEVTRTSNEDLSQSAYDSALAGVEDAKLAFANYKRCIESGAKGNGMLSEGTTITCSDIIYWMEHPDCDMVAHILGRIGKTEAGEVPINDTVITTGGEVKSDLNQAYTCVEIDGDLGDYRASLSSSSSEKLVQVALDGVEASQIKKVRIKWHSNRERAVYNYSNYLEESNRVAFQPVSAVRASTPPTLQVQLVQTAQTFLLTDFDISDGNSTDRATMFLVPSNDANAAATSSNKTSYTGIYENDENVIKANQIASTNNHQKNLPFLAYCPNDSLNDYACTVDFVLPNPVGDGTRNNGTFMFVVSLPYGQPDTDFAMEFYCADGAVCSKQNVTIEGVATEQNSSLAKLKGVQVNVDSTGRANDLYRRVEVRLEAVDTTFKYPLYALQLLDDSNSSGGVLLKDFGGTYITTEYGL